MKTVFTGVKNTDTFDSIAALLRESIHRSQSEGGLIDQSVNNFARFIGTLIFEMGTTYTGQASESALQHKFWAHRAGEKFTWCADHQWPRQVSGYKLVTKFVELGTVDKALLMRMMLKMTEVNYVTSDENRVLMEFQKVGVFTTPKEAYKRAGVVLLDWPSRALIKNLPKAYPYLC